MFEITKYHNRNYYINPKKDSIFYILENFATFRFENAMSGIYSRNIVAIFGAVFVYIFSALVILADGLLSINKKKTKLELKSRYTWVNYVEYTVQKNMFLTTFFRSIFLSVLFATKVICICLYCIYWSFKCIFRYFILPFAIILCTLLKIWAWRR